MSLSYLFDQVRSGVIHIIFVQGGNRIASGSGFMVNGHLVTNNHVFRGPPNCEVYLRFSDGDPQRLDDAIRIPYAAFSQCLVSGSDEKNFDFAILNLPQLRQHGRHQFRFAEAARRRVGTPVAFLGYPLEHLNLVCHSGLISSVFPSGPTQILQIDGSVNASNSGGPLLDIETGCVLGIITRRATGLSQMFNELIQSFDTNIRVMEGSRGMVGLAGVDPIAALIASQHQLQRVAREIERSANVGIGYAFSAEHIAGESALQSP
jgi:S1-C subfamily serine protease